jgi:hypothetical protein
LVDRGTALAKPAHSFAFRHLVSIPQRLSAVPGKDDVGPQSHRRRLAQCRLTNCLFDAVRGSLAAREASAATLSVRKIGEYLNAPRVQRDRLYRTGLIVPRVRGLDHGAADQFAPEDLDAFFDRLLGGARPVQAASEGQVTIPQAAKLTFSMSEDSSG